MLVRDGTGRAMTVGYSEVQRFLAGGGGDDGIGAVTLAQARATMDERSRDQEDLLAELRRRRDAARAERLTELAAARGDAADAAGERRDELARLEGELAAARAAHAAATT